MMGRSECQGILFQHNITSRHVGTYLHSRLLCFDLIKVKFTVNNRLTLGRIQ